MKEYTWQKVIVSWANALQLKGQSILDISDLIDGIFFINLLKQLGQEFEINGNLSEVQITEKFIKDNYSSIQINSTWDNDEVSLISSLLLLTSSLEFCHLRSPLYNLSTNIQLNIQAFIERFVSFPKTQITREVIADAINSIESIDDQHENLIAEPSSFVSSPNSSFTIYSSPDIKETTMNRVKMLQSQLEIIILDKQHLLEELEISRKELIQLDAECNGKEQELLHLKNELFQLKNSDQLNDSNISSGTSLSKDNQQLSMIREDFALVQAALYLTKSEFESSLRDNHFLKVKLETLENEKQLYKNKFEESLIKLEAMAASMENMALEISNLERTCQEQQDLLHEQVCNKKCDESIGYDDDSMLTSGPRETLASVIDLKYAELEEEAKNLRERLAEGETKMLQLQELVSKQEFLNNEENKPGKMLEISEEISGDVEKSKEMALVDNSTQISFKETFDKHQITENLQSDDGRCNIDDENKLINRLNEMLDTKNIQLEEMITLAEKLRNDINDYDTEIKTTTSTLKRIKNENDHLKTVCTINQSQISTLNDQIDRNEIKLKEKDDRIAELISEIGDRVCENDQLIIQMKINEERLLINMKNLKNKENELNDVKVLFELNKQEIDSMKNELCAKAAAIAELQHDVEMCQHEKSVLERKMENILKDLQYNESLKKEINKYEEEIVRLKKELELEKLNMKMVQDQVEFEDKLNNAFDAKLTELQAKMKNQFEKELSGSIEDHKDRINQLKLKISKDKLHIQDLSADLWNTTDRLLLSQQECEALRNQLRRTKCALEILSNSTIRRHSLATTAAVQRASNPCLWMQAEECDTNPIPVFQGNSLLTKNKGVVLSAFNVNLPNLERRPRRFSLVLENSTSNDESDEIFNDAFMKDLQEGICRIPDDNNFNVQRASCPPVAKLQESPLRLNIEKTSDRQTLIPPEKPKRKGQIAYSKPGPPTPCRSVTSRLSLQNVDQKKLKEKYIEPLYPPSTHVPSRLSKLFSTAKGSNKTKPIYQESPKVKRKSFFQRKFGSNRENLPPC